MATQCQLKHWDTIIEAQKSQPYYQQILSHIKQEQANGYTIYPPQEDIFNAFKLTEYEKVQVVIIGQDPYHGEGQAHGLSFSVKPGIKAPPSLKNIFKALRNDLGYDAPAHGDLTAWAKQGVLLLNTTLTVRAHSAHSHAKIGWSHFTDAIIDHLNDHPNPLIFMLWGAFAQQKCQHIDSSRHLVLTAPHPSPLSAHRGFLTCQHFSKANDFLRAQGKIALKWDLNQ